MTFMLRAWKTSGRVIETTVEKGVVGLYLFPNTVAIRLNPVEISCIDVWE